MNQTIQSAEVPPSPSWGSLLGGLGIAVAIFIVAVVLMERLFGKK